LQIGKCATILAVGAIHRVACGLAVSNPKEEATGRRGDAGSHMVVKGTNLGFVAVLGECVGWPTLRIPAIVDGIQ
jgi:hypothetical protein